MPHSRLVGTRFIGPDSAQGERHGGRSAGPVVAREVGAEVADRRREVELRRIGLEAGEGAAGEVRTVELGQGAVEQADRTDGHEVLPTGGGVESRRRCIPEEHCLVDAGMAVHGARTERGRRGLPGADVHCHTERRAPERQAVDPHVEGRLVEAVAADLLAVGHGGGRGPEVSRAEAAVEARAAQAARPLHRHRRRCGELGDVRALPAHRVADRDAGRALQRLARRAMRGEELHPQRRDHGVAVEDRHLRALDQSFLAPGTDVDTPRPR